ncbi:hypothetical protein [Nitratidesulfovibrio liaohensis]|uniref:Lipoprotein n=1 Tax=Nitratidesulfovibrio liaohensis TaxID=2604158 RepID=A0ABY9R565_9BACT|nr:hypothetical protein [Nitratidesulfovibrio liaohensis]WMW65745.1 hypothetical protein KPS_000254 [Nitratidesulfovibrio liaohensis]
MRWFAVLAFLVMSLACSIQTYAGGWYKTEWGMTEDDVAKSLGIYPSPYSGDPNKKSGFNYRINNYPIANKKCYVFFAIHENGLSGVGITAEDISLDDAVDFREMLVNKYGYPKEKDREINAGSNITNKITTWTTDDTNITFIHQFNGSELYSQYRKIIIQYRPKIKKENPENNEDRF